MKVVSLSKDRSHRFSKQPCDSLVLLEGLGVEGDAHCGATVQHRSRVKTDPTQPNLRQVHLMQTELLADLRAQGFWVEPGTMGENILTEGIDLLSLPRNTRLKIGTEVVLRITGLRNPCAQLDNYQLGLTQAVLDRDPDGNLLLKAGIMAVVESGGPVTLGSPISIKLPSEPYEKLERV